MPNEPDFILAHRACANNRPQLEKGGRCGCFYCLKIFDAKEIVSWVVADTPIDRQGTALCPYCMIDSVIGEGSGYPVTPEFLQKMHDYWFE